MSGRQRKARAASAIGAEASAIEKILRSLTGRRGLYDVWRDWTTCMGLSIANGVDHRESVWRTREDEYLAIVKRYEPDEVNRFPEMTGLVVQALEGDEPRDFLGELYMGLELGNADAGQFFTPASICAVMADLIMPGHREIIERRGYVSLHEPAVGGGATIIAAARSIAADGFHPSKHLLVQAWDIDRKVLLMAYAQCSLLGIPGVFIVGDTLRMEVRDVFYTPVYVFDGWAQRLRFEDQCAAMLQALRAMTDDAEPTLDDVPGDESPMVEALPVELEQSNDTPKPGVLVQGDLFSGFG